MQILLCRYLEHISSTYPQWITDQTSHVQEELLAIDSDLQSIANQRYDARLLGYMHDFVPSCTIIRAHTVHTGKLIAL